uniref:Peptidase S1 domain-containing protein n=1 Tax=Anopheles farauti TaxID=69004 RepID=A0A182Q858_9DIPT
MNFLVILPVLLFCCVHSEHLRYGRNSGAEDSFTEYSTEDPHRGTTDATEELFAYQDWFTFPLTTSNPMKFQTEEAISERSVESTEEENSYLEEFEPRLMIEYTTYSALLYQEDEFGLEFLCSGYWLRRGILLVRGDCWPKDSTLSTDVLVDLVIANDELNLLILQLHRNTEAPSEDEQLHLANIEGNFSRESVKDCALYMLQDDYTKFEAFSWSIRAVPFKQAKRECCDGHICLRTRPSAAAHGVDYALICGQSLAGMLTTERSKFERVLGKLTLLDVSRAKAWIEEALEELAGEYVLDVESSTEFLSLSVTTMPPADMYDLDVDNSGDGML